MTCEQCKYMTVCMAQADCLGQIFDPNYDGEHGCTDFAPCTNADLIRSMSDEELAELLSEPCECSVDPEEDGYRECGNKLCIEYLLNWLQQPAEQQKEET